MFLTLLFLLHSTLSFSIWGQATRLSSTEKQTKLLSSLSRNPDLQSDCPSMIVRSFYFYFCNCIFLGKQWLRSTTCLFIYTICLLNKNIGVNAFVESMVVYPPFYVSLDITLLRLVRHLLLKKNLTLFLSCTILDM